MRICANRHQYTIQFIRTYIADTRKGLSRYEKATRFHVAANYSMYILCIIIDYDNICIQLGPK